MKRFIYSIVTLLSICTLGYSQSIDDVVRSSQLFPLGTSRFNSMGGAFTALGGDISSANQNPAGIALFRSSEITITPTLSTARTTATFDRNAIAEQKSKFYLPQFGIVLSNINTNKSKGWLGFNVAYTYNQSNNYMRDSHLKGISNSSSAVDSWREEADGFHPNFLSGAALLAYNTYLIDSLQDIPNLYGTTFNNYGAEPSLYGQTIRKVTSTSGQSREHAITLGGNYSDILYIGATLGISRFSYTENYFYAEYGTPQHDLNYFAYDYSFSSVGDGINFKIGAIIRPIEPLRIGLSYHTPTYYVIKDKIADSMTADYTTVATDESFNYTSKGESSWYSYELRTPSRFMLGLAYQIGKIATISADYEFINYSKAKLSDHGDNFDYSIRNSDIKYILSSSNNIRVGGEVRLSPFYIRGGFAFYGSPWAVGDYNSDNNFKIASAGFGYRANAFSIDLAYSLMFFKQTELIYRTISDIPTADFDRSMQNIAITLGYRF